MKESNRHVTRVREHFDKIIEGIELISGGTLNSDFKWSLNRIIECTEEFFKRGPFNVGDKVQIIKAPVIDENSGWRGSKHFLIEGAQGWVHSVDFREGKFTAEVMWDDESYISKHDFPNKGVKEGDVIPSDSKGIYCMWEGQIERVEVPECKMDHDTALRVLVDNRSEGEQRQLYCYTFCCPECHKDLDTTEIQKEYKKDPAQ